jgi:hypothetical protein
MPRRNSDRPVSFMKMMPAVAVTTVCTHRFFVTAVVAAFAVMWSVWLPANASASHSQIAIISDPGDLAAPQQTLAQFRELGATTVRVVVPWATIAPQPRSVKKPSFNATNPNAYPAGAWAPYDALVHTAQHDGLTVDFAISGGLRAGPRARAFRRAAAIFVSRGSPARRPTGSLFAPSVPATTAISRRPGIPCRCPRCISGRSSTNRTSVRTSPLRPSTAPACRSRR